IDRRASTPRAPTEETAIDRPSSAPPTVSRSRPPTQETSIDRAISPASRASSSDDRATSIERRGGRPSEDAKAADEPRVEEPARRTHGGSSVSLSTAADAMRDEEIHRTRQFIAAGWVVSIAAIGSVPLLDAPRAMSIAVVVALVWGIVMSSYFFRR